MKTRNVAFLVKYKYINSLFAHKNDTEHVTFLRNYNKSNNCFTENILYL